MEGSENVISGGNGENDVWDADISVFLAEEEDAWVATDEDKGGVEDDEGAGFSSASDMGVSSQGEKHSELSSTTVSLARL